MSLTDKLKETYERTKIKVKHPTLLAAKGLEGTLNFTAPIAAAMTVGAEPEYSVPEKILYGPFQVTKGIYESISAYVQNTGVRDFVNGTMSQVFELVGNAAQNIAESPVETVTTLLATYAVGKTAAYTTKLLRQSKEDKYLKKDKSQN